ncbi:MAG TPA: hypothetical protein VF113_04740 [Stellaceae bacterium]
MKRATDRTRGCFEPIDVFRQAGAGQVGIWFIEDDGRLIGVTAARIAQYPRKRLLCIDFVAGRRLAEWWPVFVEEMDTFARSRGCDEIAAYGRPGWVRFWRQRGVAAKVASEIMVRAL